MPAIPIRIDGRLPVKNNPRDKIWPMLQPKHQSMLEPRSHEINWGDSVSILWVSNNPNLFSALAYSSAALIAGCLAGLFGLLFHILFYYKGYRDSIVNGFFFDSSLSLTFHNA